MKLAKYSKAYRNASLHVQWPNVGDANDWCPINMLQHKPIDSTIFHWQSNPIKMFDGHQSSLILNNCIWEEEYEAKVFGKIRTDDSISVPSTQYMVISPKPPNIDVYMGKKYGSWSCNTNIMLRHESHIFIQDDLQLIPLQLLCSKPRTVPTSARCMAWKCGHSIFGWLCRMEQTWWMCVYVEMGGVNSCNSLIWRCIQMIWYSFSCTFVVDWLAPRSSMRSTSRSDSIGKLTNMTATIVSNPIIDIHAMVSIIVCITSARIRPAELSRSMPGIKSGNVG